MVAWSLSVVSVAYCSFVKVEYEAQGSEKLLGLFSYDSSSIFSTSNSTGNFCARYDDGAFETYFNSAGRSARAFGVLAALLSGSALFLDAALELVWEWAVVSVWKTCAVFISLAFLFQALTFLVLLIKPCHLDGVRCTIDATGIISGISCIFSVLSATMMGCVARPPNKPLFPISEMRDHHSSKLRYACNCGIQILLRALLNSTIIASQVDNLWTSHSYVDSLCCGSRRLYLC